MKRIIVVLALFACVAGCEVNQESWDRRTEEGTADRERPGSASPEQLSRSPGPRLVRPCHDARSSAGSTDSTRPTTCGRPTATASTRKTCRQVRPRRNPLRLRDRWRRSFPGMDLSHAARLRHHGDGRLHMVALVHLDDKWAAILDNNNVERFIWVPRETLIAEWKASYGWAVTPIYTPAAPLPQ